jgi:hypothetical protein
VRVEVCERGEVRSICAGRGHKRQTNERMHYLDLTSVSATIDGGHGSGGHPVAFIRAATSISVHEDG